jgi:hypothetical protein
VGIEVVGDSDVVVVALEIVVVAADEVDEVVAARWEPAEHAPRPSAPRTKTAMSRARTGEEYRGRGACPGFRSGAAHTGAVDDSDGAVG